MAATGATVAAGQNQSSGAIISSPSQSIPCPATGTQSVLSAAGNLIKLTASNFSLWETTIVPFLKGNDLYKFVDGSHQCPRQNHWQAVKRILRYLAGTKHLGLFFSSTPSGSLQVFVDADWGGSLLDRRSTSGYLLFMGTHLLAWSSRKQPHVARSSTEAEYKALANGVAEILGIQQIIADLGLHISHPPMINCDNLGATYLALNPVHHSRVKHVDLDYHFVRERVKNRSLQILHVPSSAQLADMLTKPLQTPQFLHFRSILPLSGRFDSRGDSENIVSEPTKQSLEIDR